MPLFNKSDIDNISLSSSSNRVNSANIKSVSVNLIGTAAFDFNYKQNKTVIKAATFNKIKYKL